MKQLDPKAVWLFFLSRTAAIYISIFILIASILWLANVAKFDFLAVILSAFFGLGFSLMVTGPTLIITYIWARLFYKSYKYEVRGDSFRKEYGVIWKGYVSIPYHRIQNVDIYRGLLARLLGLSDLRIQTAGMSGIPTSEGRLPGLNPKVAEELRDELIKRSRLNEKALEA